MESYRTFYNAIHELIVHDNVKEPWYMLKIGNMENNRYKEISLDEREFNALCNLIIEYEASRGKVVSEEKGRVKE